MIIVGLDVGRERHGFRVLDPVKKTLTSGVLANESRAFTEWAERIESLGPDIRVALEATNGLATPLDQFLLERGWEVLEVPASAVKSYRENVMRQHNKTDATDAHALACLAIDSGDVFQAREQPRRTLRRLTRCRFTLIKEKTQAVNRLRRSVAACWPELTEGAVRDLSAGYVLTILECHPDPAEISHLGVEGLRTVLRARGSGSGVTDNMLEKLVVLAQKNAVSPEEKPVILKEIRFLARRLRHQVEDLQAIEAIIEDAAASDEDVVELDSWPGVGTFQAAAFVAEVQSITNFSTEGQLASYAGLALRRQQTGKTLDRKHPQLRANRFLKQAAQNMATWGRAFHDPQSHEYYKRKMGEGKDHLQALRALARHMVRAIFITLRRRQLPSRGVVQR